ncbi:MAG: tetratricopeptide repeat protein [Rhodospirillales bacterium]|nr:tetratricopeptide repeat protein [Rhodospirillales bacterium]
MLKSIAVALTILMAVVPHQAFAAGSGGGSEQASEIQQSRALLKEGNHAKAEGLLRKAVADDPENADAWNLLGYANRMQGNLDEAEKFYTTALDLEPKHLGAMQYMGMLYVKTGRVDEAKKLLARIDDACFFSCSEYDDLKRAIETGKTDQDPGW